VPPARRRRADVSSTPHATACCGVQYATIFFLQACAASAYIEALTIREPALAFSRLVQIVAPKIMLWRAGLGRPPAAARFLLTRQLPRHARLNDKNKRTERRGLSRHPIVVSAISSLPPRELPVLRNCDIAVRHFSYLGIVRANVAQDFIDIALVF
jgi:hypothetical protein